MQLDCRRLNLFVKHRHRNDFLIGSAQFEATHRVVITIYIMKTWGGTCPWCCPVPTHMSENSGSCLTVLVQPKSREVKVMIHQGACVVMEN